MIVAQVAGTTEESGTRNYHDECRIAVNTISGASAMIPLNTLWYGTKEEILSALDVPYISGDLKFISPDSKICHRRDITPDFPGVTVYIQPREEEDPVLPNWVETYYFHKLPELGIPSRKLRIPAKTFNPYQSGRPIAAEIGLFYDEPKLLNREFKIKYELEVVIGNQNSLAITRIPVVGVKIRGLIQKTRRHGEVIGKVIDPFDLKPLFSMTMMQDECGNMAWRSYRASFREGEASLREGEATFPMKAIMEMRLVASKGSEYPEKYIHDGQHALFVVKIFHKPEMAMETMCSQIGEFFSKSGIDYNAYHKFVGCRNETYIDWNTDGLEEKSREAFLDNFPKTILTAILVASGYDRPTILSGKTSVPPSAPPQ